MQSKYDTYSSSDSQSYDNVEVRIQPFTTIRGTLSRAFGVSSDRGQSLGLNMTDVSLVDGALYLDNDVTDPDDQTFKLFSWADVVGLSPVEKLDRGEDPSIDDAPDVERRTYFGDTKTYELVAARLPEVTDDDGNVVVEAQSKSRDVDITADGPDFGSFENRGGDVIEIGDTISWYDGSNEYGPSVTASRLVERLTTHGEVADEDDIYNWLPDTSGDNILRDDLQGREVEFFIVTRQGENNPYRVPVLEDTATGEEIGPNNRSPDTGGESDELKEAKEDDSGAYPEPVADYISSGRDLNLNEERANNLLDDLIADSDNAMTEAMVEDAGGREHLIEQVT